MISDLIDKQDNFEIVRDQIAYILLSEVTSQMALAVDAAKDPDLWKLRIFSERSNAWEQWLEIGDDTDLSPLVNVEFDSTAIDSRSSNTTKRQAHDATFNLDCFAVGISGDEDGTGHQTGDKEAIFNSHRALRLVRNILMADIYTYLGIRSIVAQRKHMNSVVFRPEFNNTVVQHVVGSRLVFQVRFSEFTNEQTAEILEFLSITTLRTEDGEILFQSDFDYT